MGKQHGTLAKAGKVRKQTPKVARIEKARKPRGRAYKRILYKKNFAPVVPGQKKRTPNWNAGRPEIAKKWFRNHIFLFNMAYIIKITGFADDNLKWNGYGTSLLYERIEKS